MTASEKIEIELQNHYKYVSGRAKVILISSFIYENLKNELSGITNFNFDKKDMRYRGIEIFEVHSLDKNKVRIF
jgi:hypothetical protein